MGEIVVGVHNECKDQDAAPQAKTLVAQKFIFGASYST